MNAETMKPDERCNAAGLLLTNNPGQDKHMNKARVSTAAMPALPRKTGKPWSNRLLHSLIGHRLERLPDAIELPRDHPDFERVRCEVIKKDAEGKRTRVVDAFWTIERRLKPAPSRLAMRRRRKVSALLTPPEHEHSAAIDQAARWLALLPAHQRPSPIVPAICQRFGLRPVEACQALRESALIRGRAQ